MNKITADWTPALDPSGAALLDDGSWATDESQMTYTVHVPTFAGAFVESVGDRVTGGNKGGGGGEAFDQNNVWNIHKFIGQCLGYTKHITPNQLSRTPNQLSRWLPARHPFSPHLRAAKITRMHGIGEKRQRVLSPLSRAVVGGRQVFIQVPQTWELTILFQSLTYECLEDVQIVTESQRFVTNLVTPTTEILSKPGGTYTFVGGSGVATGKDFPQPIGLLYGTYDVVSTWHQVPKSAILNADGLPTRIAALIGKVNNDTVTGLFLPSVAVDVGVGGGGADVSGYVTYAPGQVLLTGAVITPELSPIPPQMMGISILDTPRTYRVEYHLKVDPQGHNKKPFDADGGAQFYLVTHNGLFPPGGKTIYQTADFKLLYTPLNLGA